MIGASAGEPGFRRCQGIRRLVGLTKGPLTPWERGDGYMSAGSQQLDLECQCWLLIDPMLQESEWTMPGLVHLDLLWQLAAAAESDLSAVANMYAAGKNFFVPSPGKWPRTCPRQVILVVQRFRELVEANDYANPPATLFRRFVVK